MSGLAGVYFRDGAPVEACLLERLMRVVPYRATEGVSCWTQGNLGFAYGRQDSLGAPCAGAQPVQDETGTHCLVWDGRLDNRAELARELRTERLSDAELVLQAYLRWGEDVPARLIGDFALALWDGAKRQLLCARDVLGIKPFYYYEDGVRFVFGSTLRQMIEAPFVPRALNEGMLGEYLWYSVSSVEETLFQRVFRLPPASRLIVREGECKISRYWNPDPERRIVHRTDADYAEQFTEIFREATRCRLQSHRPVGLLLSGGLDSSSVVVMAQELQDAGQAANPGMESFSLRFPGLPCDETAYIQEVAAQTRFPSNALPPIETDPTWYTRNITEYAELPDYPNGAMMNVLYERMHARGMRVVLTGLGGDQWFAGCDYSVADSWRSLNPGAIWGDLRRGVAWGGTRYALVSQVRYGLYPHLPPRFVQWARGRRKPAALPRWIRPEFAQRIGLLERVRTERPRWRKATFAQNELIETLLSPQHTHSYGMQERYNARYGLEGRHPFQDRRLIEFSMAIPEDQRWRGSQTKYVLRQSMQGRLPESVRLRSGKAEFSAVSVRAIQSQWGEDRVCLPSLSALGAIQTEAVQEMYQEMRRQFQETGGASYLFLLWKMIGLERWLREYANP